MPLTLHTRSLAAAFIAAITVLWGAVALPYPGTRSTNESLNAATSDTSTLVPATIPTTAYAFTTVLDDEALDIAHLTPAILGRTTLSMVSSLVEASVESPVTLRALAHEPFGQRAPPRG